MIKPATLEPTVKFHTVNENEVQVRRIVASDSTTPSVDDMVSRIDVADISEISIFIVT